jgi:Holliday junction resolvase
MLNLTTIDDQARGVYKILSKYGYTSDPTEVSRRIAVLHNGLVHEDEFLYVLGWFGRIRLAHKLEQTTVPPKAGLEFGIPDLFMIVDVEGSHKPYFVEIKTTKKTELAWPKKYYQSLVNYSHQTGIPVLIAWKWTSFDLWALNRLEDFHQENPSSKYRLSLDRAYKRNLMSPLLGDFAVWLPDDFALVIEQRKTKKLENGWETFVENVYISGSNGRRVTLDNNLLAVLHSLGIDEVIEETDNYIYLKLVPSPNRSLFVQTMPIRLNERLTEKQVHWQKLISESNFPIEYDSLLRSLTDGINNGGVEGILFTTPNYDS